MNPKRLWLSILAVAGLPVAATVATANPPEGESPTLMRTPYEVGGVEGEAIDLRTLNVSWQSVDLVVPGNGGMDIVVSRSFGKVPVHASGGFITKWTVDNPRIAISSNPNGVLEGLVSGVGACENPEAYHYNIYPTPPWPESPVVWGHEYRAPIVMVLPGQEPQTLMYKKASATQYPASAKYVTIENTYVECASNGTTFIATTADGTTYHFDVSGWGPGDQFDGSFGGYSSYSASRVEDVHGNWIDYSYVSSNGTNKLPKTITASDGRTVEFHYASPTSGRLDRITANGRTWYYDYDTNVQGNTYLSGVRMPEGLEWNYSHDGPTDILNYGAISQVITPTGATIDYDYNPATGGDYAKLKQRTVTGSSVPTGVWDYTYTELHAFEDVTVVGPAGRADYRFHRGYSNLSDVHIWGFADSWVAGRLQRAIFRDSNPAVVLRTVEYEYAGLPEIGEEGANHNNPRVLPHQRRHVLSSRVTTTDNLTGAVFIEENSSFDDYGNPGTLVETGTQNRTTNLTYFNNTTNWIIGLIDTETIVGIGTIDRDYFANGLLSQLDEYGIVRNYEYHSTGDLWKEKWTRDGVAHESVYSNYYRGIARQEDHPESVSRSREVNATGTLQWERDARGNQTSYLYDDLMRVRLITPPADAPRTITWSSPTLQVVTQGAYRKETTLDALGRILVEKERDTAWAPGRYLYRTRAYDSAGRLSFEAFASEDPLEPDGATFQYDGLDRMTTVTNTADSTVRTYCYGSPCDIASEYGTGLVNGQIVTDERGYETAYEYQSFGSPESKSVTKISQQVRKASEPGGLKFIDTDILRNELGNMETVTQGGHTRTYTYNVRQELWWLVEPERGATEFGYDSMGNLDFKMVGSGPATQYDYDGLNRQIYIDYPSGTADVTIDYDDDNNVRLVSSGPSVWTYTYDAQSRLKTETLAIEGQSFGFTYDYDNIGGLSQLTYPGSVTAAFNPDALGRPTTVGGYVTAVDYHPDGQLSAVTYGDGHVRNISLTPRRFPDVVTVAKGPSTVLSLDYGYDVIGNTTSIADALNPSANRVFGYDGTSRLVSASGAWGNSSYLYDDTGNLTNKTLGTNSYTYNIDTTNKLSSITGSQSLTFSYDQYGNVTGNGLQTFDYNDASQLVAVPSIPGTSYVYDGNGRRVKAVRTSGTDYSVYSKDGLLLYSRDVANDVSREYHYLGSMLVAKREFGAGVNDDTDGDGIPDDIELQLGLDPANANDGAGDLDGDGASNAEEYQVGTRLDDADTDGDGMSDGYEIRHGLDPFTDDSGLDGDGDGLTNLQEYQLNTNPNNPDTDNDGLADGVDPNPLFNPALIPILTHILLN